MTKQLLKRYLLGLIIALPVLGSAQTNNFNSVFDTIPLNDQFDYLYRKSSTYQEYKVVSIQGYNLIKKNSLDSVKIYKSEIGTLNTKIDQFNLDLNDRNTEIDSLKNELIITRNSKDSIAFLGAEIPKKTYNLILWSLLIIIGTAAAVLFLLFKRGHQVVKETKQRLNEVMEDFENHRKNALVREQKLARELMDVKLKYKGR